MNKHGLRIIIFVLVVPTAAGATVGAAIGWAAGLPIALSSALGAAIADGVTASALWLMFKDFRM